jgi:hypothetical protein
MHVWVSHHCTNTGSTCIHCNDDVTTDYDAAVYVHLRITPICIEIREINRSITSTTIHRLSLGLVASYVL